MAEAVRDQNHVTVMLFESATTPGLTVNATGDQTTGRLYVDVAGGSGTVTSVSVVTANGFAGSVANATTTPAITISTTINAPVLAGNGTAISAATTTGSGSTVVLATSPTLVTPVLGVATATSINGLTITSTTGTLTLANGSTLVTSGANSITLTSTGATNVTLPTSGTLMTNPMTTGGDVIYGGASGVPTRLANGSAGQVLTSGGTTVAPTWETPSSSVPTTITVANEATDTTCFVAFFTAATGDLGPKTNVNMTFNSNTGVVTFASSVLTTTDINGGTIDGTIIGGASAAAGTFTTLTATAIRAASNDSGSIGVSGTAFSDLFLASGAIIDFAAGNSVITHSSAVLTVSTGDLRVTTAGTNSASVVTVGGTQTLTAKTLTSPTINAATISGVFQMAESTSIAYDAALSADGTWCGDTRAGTAGATLAFGDLVYLASADSRWELADADAATTSDRFLGMCVLAAASDGDPTVILLKGFIRADAAFPAMTIGSAMYVGETAGDIQVAIPTGADNVIRRVGYAWTADELYFNPSMDSQITVA